MMLNSKQISHLKGLSHSLNPVVQIGHKGLTDSVINEIQISIKAHELIKIKLQEKDRNKRKLILDEICKKINGQAINQIGMQIVIFKASEPSKILLP
ncbi:MAG: YhbY family RNA-binding protein [Nitrosomonadales bacterium]|nr:YhbY family RNA-binding protein [Nitrosomonadales bacterium]